MLLRKLRLALQEAKLCDKVHTELMISTNIVYCRFIISVCTNNRTTTELV